MSLAATFPRIQILAKRDLWTRCARSRGYVATGTTGALHAANQAGCCPLPAHRLGSCLLMKRRILPCLPTWKAKSRGRFMTARTQETKTRPTKSKQAVTPQAPCKPQPGRVLLVKQKTPGHGGRLGVFWLLRIPGDGQEKPRQSYLRVVETATCLFAGKPCIAAHPHPTKRYGT